MDYRAAAIEAANRNGVPVDLFLKLVGQESAYNPNALSNKGAQGLAQLMPGTARELGVDPTDPLQNLDGGARYLKQQLNTFGDPALALAAYNAGPGAVKKYGGIPPFKETQNYVAKIMGGAVPAPTISTSGGGANMGVLDFLQNGGDAEPEKKEGWFNQDRRHKLAIGLGGMTLNPNVPFLQNLQQGIDTRAAEKKEKGAINKTVALLAQKRPDLAALVQAGAIPPGDAVKMMLTPTEKTALQQNVEYLVAQGYTVEEALSKVSSAAGASKPGYMGTIPPGHMIVEELDASGNKVIKMVPVPGGPAAAEASETQAAAAAKTENVEKYKGAAVVAAEKAVEMLGTNGARDWFPDAGIVGDKLAKWGLNQEAVDIKNTINTVKSGIAFNRLQDMRDASKTGGALGSVSAPELELLMSSLGSLEQSNSPELLVQNLKTVITIMTKIENDPVASAFYSGGGRGATPPATASAGTSVGADGFTVNGTLP